MRYRMKPNGPDITIVDGPLAVRTYRSGASYDEIPPGYEDRFEPVADTSGTYRIDDVASGTQIKGDTAFTPVSSTHELTISDTENAILDADNERELRCVTEAEEGGDAQ